jgi:uncharacterized membrane protein required for colicin V production
MQVELGSWLNGLTPFFAAAADTATKVATKASEPAAAISFGLFDVLLIIVAGVGIWRGKERGISEELLELIQWLVTIVAAGFLYSLVGDLLAAAKMPRLVANISGYISIIIVVSIIFKFISKSVGNKLVDSDFFGSWEYRLGMMAGALRYLSIWFVLLALLSARYFDADLVAAQRKAQEKETGVVLLPTWGIVNRMALYESFTGPYIRKYLGPLLMTPVGFAKVAPNENTIGKQQQRVLDAVTAPPATPTPPPEKK